MPLNLNHGFSKSLTFRHRLTRGKSSYVIRSQKNRDDDGDVDGFYMRKSVELARKALGCTSPNPLVGCVIVKDGQIVGQGFHPKPGQPHAEVRLVSHSLNSNHHFRVTAFLFLRFFRCLL